MSKRGLCVALLLMACVATACFAADTLPVGQAADVKTGTPAPAAADERKVSITADVTEAAEALASLAEQSGEKLVIESTVKGKVTLTLSDVSLETALAALCKSQGFQWRKMYLDPESKLLEQPDKLAASVRLASGLSMPDIVVAGSSAGSVGVYSSDKKAVKAVEDKASGELGMKRLYLVSNDSAVASKGADERSAAVDKYIETNKKLMEDFMKLSPEEQEQAITAGISMFEQMDPSYMSSVMQAVMRTDPELLRRMSARNTEMLFHMDPQQRRSMMKMNMEMMKSITPEQMQILQEDAKAVMEEMQNQGGQ